MHPSPCTRATRPRRGASALVLGLRSTALISVAVATLAVAPAAPVIAAPPTGGARTCSSPVDVSSATVSNTFGLDRSNTREQASSITSSNVAGLRQQWTHVAVGATGKRGAPAVTGQAVFLSSGNSIVAIDRATGCTFWTFTGKTGDLGATLGPNLMRAASIVLVRDRSDRRPVVVAGDGLGWVYGLDAVTGRPVWETRAGSFPQYTWITGGFQYADGKILVPISSREVITTAASVSACCTSHGQVQALDAYTGAVDWTWDATGPARPVSGKAPLLGPSGGGVWNTPAVDLATRTVYFGTGQNYSPPLTANSDAIVAVDLDTGRQKWAFKGVPDDVWNAFCEVPLAPDAVRALKCPSVGKDWDFGSSPLITTTPSGRKIVIAANKAGAAYGIDAASGKKVWANQLGVGSALGGNHWGIATDGSKVYVPIADTFANKAALLASPLEAITPDGLNVPAQPVADGRPGIYALDVATGRTVWAIHPTHLYRGKRYISVYSAAPSVTNDVLFAGSLDGRLRAFSTRDGRELYSFDSNIGVTDRAGNTGHGGTIDAVGAIPFGDSVLLNSGYDNFGGKDAYQAGKGNVLFDLQLPAR